MTMIERDATRARARRRGPPPALASAEPGGPRLDLNLLVVFDAVMGERSVTRAARRLGLTQPAVSNALARLRAHLDDALFVRAPGGIRPTARALDLAGPVRRALAGLGEALDDAAFDPAASRRAFRIALCETARLALGPQLAARLASEAPQTEAALRRLPAGLDRAAALEREGIDLAVAPGPSTVGGGEPPLWVCDWAVVVGEQHPFVRRAPDAERLLAARRIGVEPPGGETLDLCPAALSGARPALTCPSLEAAGPLLRAADLALAAPRAAANALAQMGGLVVLPMPIAAPPLAFRIVAPPHAAGAAWSGWLRGVIAAAAQASEAIQGMRPTGTPSASRASTSGAVASP